MVNLVNSARANAHSTQQTSIEKILPLDLITHIFSYLDYSSLHNCFCTSKSFQKVVITTELLKVHNLVNRLLERLTEHSSQAQALKMLNANLPKTAELQSNQGALHNFLLNTEEKIANTLRELSHTNLCALSLSLADTLRPNGLKHVFELSKNYYYLDYFIKQIRGDATSELMHKVCIELIKINHIERARDEANMFFSDSDSSEASWKAAVLSEVSEALSKRDQAKKSY